MIHLTPREMEICICLVAGIQSDRDLGFIFKIHPRTVIRHLRNIYEKTGQEDRTNLVVFCIRKGIVRRKDCEEFIEYSYRRNSVGALLPAVRANFTRSSYS